MIPPASPALIAANPNFEKLHSRLTNDLLDQDASTRSANFSAQTTCDRLEVERIDVVRSRLLTASLVDAAYSSGLPADLKELVLIIASYIADAPGLGLTREDEGVLSEDIGKFRDRLPEISDLLAEKLSDQHDSLRAVAAAGQDAMFDVKGPSSGATDRNRTRQRDEQPLHDIVDSQVSHLAHLRGHSLPTALHEITNMLVSLLHSQAEHLHHLVRHLEQRRHGADSRHLTAKAQFLSTIAQGLQAKTQVSYLEQRRDLYSPDLVKNLEQKMSVLDEEEMRLEQRIRKLQAALAEYDDAGLDVMKTLSRKYGETEKETQEVQDDIERLNKRDEV